MRPSAIFLMNAICRSCRSTQVHCRGRLNHFLHQLVHMIGSINLRKVSFFSPDAGPSVSSTSITSNNDPAKYLSIDNSSPNDKRRFVFRGPLQPQIQGRPLILKSIIMKQQSWYHWCVATTNMAIVFTAVGQSVLCRMFVVWR